MPSSKYKTPEQINPQSLGDYLDVMSKAIFQTGMSWRVVENKWPGTREVFHNFDAERVASMSLDEIDAIAQDTRVIRNRRKIEAIVSNAFKMVELADQHGSFKSYLGSHGGFEGTVAALRREFKFLGDTGAYYLLYVVGEEVPSHEEWMESRGR